ncbi:hypothetical protein ON010_g16887 [Phytophthora cinnamomi]|nr:hypothetical protein ON010_g16887 [Phytophthora cinnamomi]
MAAAAHYLSPTGAYDFGVGTIDTSQALGVPVLHGVWHSSLRETARSTRSMDQPLVGADDELTSIIEECKSTTRSLTRLGQSSVRAHPGADEPATELSAPRSPAIAQKPDVIGPPACHYRGSVSRTYVTLGPAPVRTADEDVPRDDQPERDPTVYEAQFELWAGESRHLMEALRASFSEVIVRVERRFRFEYAKLRACCWLPISLAGRCIAPRSFEQCSFSASRGRSSCGSGLAPEYCS